MATAPVWPWKPRIALVSTAAVAVLIAAAFLVARWQRSDVDRFWRPMLDAPGGVLFCLGQSRAYNFRSDARHPGRRDLPFAAHLLVREAREAVSDPR